MSLCERVRELHACCPGRQRRREPVLIDPVPSLRPSMWNLCDLAVAPAAGPSMQRGRKSEKKGELAWTESDELYSCRNPDGVKIK